MLSLESPEWSNLVDAYGEASGIPGLLSQLETFPSDRGRAEPWFSLWSALAHQGDVYSASFAAVPHVVRVLALAPERASGSFFQFPAWVEICRHRKNVSVPDALSASYTQAIERLPHLVCAVAARPWDKGFLHCALGAMAVGKGSPELAEVLLELSPDDLKDFREWQNSR
ncbi:hypothetical protein [Granulicella sp. S156]|jgi:hypothetical protein|uniref:hypothetical protein n=1 Tax=Granulicella sp. S156 TaxID=1747224 RepID=UPI00131DB633|nr:hypothetical protein [Granulicella sp. S156]